jgi:putative endonuclease
MSKEYNFYVYVMASFTGTIYVGVTRDVVKRAWQHKNNIGSAFTKKYQCHHLVYVENYDDIRDAIKREKQIKKFSRLKKNKLIESRNPEWNDLYEMYLK